MLSQKQHILPVPLPGFENVNRYWDIRNQQAAAKILPGEYYVTDQDELITTVLGSCVSACVRDTVFGIGGMNHFMLPTSEKGHWHGASDVESSATRYGNYAMEHMINDILSHGGHRKHLEIKLFGGAMVMKGMTDIGQRNIEFIRDYVNVEKLDLVSQDLGDIHPRKVIYFPSTGKVLVKKLQHMHNDTLIKRETKYRHDLEEHPLEGDVELFGND